MKEKINLRLIGNSIEDLSTFSAYLQDSLIKIKDISYLKKNRIFILLFNRFMWEDVEKGIFRDYKRIPCVVRLFGILIVISLNILQKIKDKILELYLNQFYLGSGAYGVAAASLEYFDKSIKEIDYS